MTGLLAFDAGNWQLAQSVSTGEGGEENLCSTPLCASGKKKRRNAESNVPRLRASRLPSLSHREPEAGRLGAGPNFQNCYHFPSENSERNQSQTI